MLREYVDRANSSVGEQINTIKSSILIIKKNRNTPIDATKVKKESHEKLKIWKIFDRFNAKVNDILKKKNMLNIFD